MPTDPSELERELFDFENAASNTTYGMSVGGPCWHTHLAALRQYADPRTALALRVLAIVENPTDEIGNAIGHATFGHLEGWAACRAILALMKGETP